MSDISLNNLPKIGSKSAKRRGQGIGSGKGSHTSGRGQKGQKARERVGILFEGTKTKKSLLKRLPLLRGKGKFKPKRGKPAVINLKDLASLPAGSEITPEFLIKSGICDSPNVKILGEGKLTTALIFKVKTSKSAAEKIKKAGGQVI